MHAGLSNYFSAVQDPTNAQSTPAYDEWGPDFRGYWSVDNWITWHQALVQTYGQQSANQKFAAAWNAQGVGAQPVTQLDYNEYARQYFVASGLAALIDPTVGGFITDALSTGSTAVGSMAAAASKLNWVVPIAGLALLYFAVQAIGKDPGGQSKKFLSGVRELY